MPDFLETVRLNAELRTRAELLTRRPEMAPAEPVRQRAGQAVRDAPSRSRGAFPDPLVILGRECPWRGCRACRGVSRCWANLGNHLGRRMTDDSGCKECIEVNMFNRGSVCVER